MALKENYRELLIDAVVRVAAREGHNDQADRGGGSVQ